MLALAALASVCSWFALDAPGRGPRVPVGSRAMALYPLPAVHLPGAACELRNIEPRNIAMCREQSEFVAALVDADGSRCASVGSVLRIDDVRPASSDNSGRVLTSLESATVLRVRCTVVGRARIVGCANLEAWRDWRRAREHAEYLVADVVDYSDDESGSGSRSSGSTSCGEDVMEDVVDDLFRLVDALLAAPEESQSGLDVAAVVASLEDAASLCEDGRWWDALELWQRYCATRSAAELMRHRAERDELLIDAKLKQGGMLSLPVNERALPPADRARLRDLDARAHDATSQMELDDSASFQACLESRLPAERAERLQQGVQREAGRLARRAALQRALDAS